MNKPARRVAPGTFIKTPYVQPVDQRSPGDYGYDWRNPNHNPSGKPPEAYKAPTEWKASNYPIFETEFNRRLFEPDFVAYLKDTYGAEEWDQFSELEQIAAHIDMVSDMRHPQFEGSVQKYDDYVKARALYLQSKINRGTPQEIAAAKIKKEKQEIQKHVRALRKMAKGCHELGPSDFIDDLKLDSVMRRKVFDALIG